MRIKMTGASDLKNAQFNIGTLLMEVSGASTFKANTQSTNVTIDCSGASSVELNGSADDLAVECSGASNAKLGNLKVKGAVVQSSGASDVSVHASQLLKLSASGASSIYYAGEAKISETHSSGASSIKRRND
jgi:preprotein translocase subunit SecF